jgi:hypothetical protein
MDLSARFSAALAAISPELVPENGYCALSVDARLVLHVALDEASGAVVLWSNLATVPSGDTLSKRLLHANYFWQGTGGATWSLDPATNTPVLAERLSAAQWEGVEFDGLLQRFADRALAWETELSEPGDTTTAPATFAPEAFGNPFLRA